jgi:hypothetical protein
MARYDDGALCTDDTVPGTGHKPAVHPKTKTTGTGHRTSGTKHDTTPGYENNPNLVAALHPTSILEVAIKEHHPLFLPAGYTPKKLCQDDAVGFHTMAETSGIVSTLRSSRNRPLPQGRKLPTSSNSWLLHHPPRPPHPKRRTSTKSRKNNKGSRSSREKCRRVC